MTSSERSCRPAVYHSRWGNPVKCLSQRHNKKNLPSCSTHYYCPFNSERPVRKLRTRFLSHWFHPIGIILELKAPEANALTTQPSQQYISLASTVIKKYYRTCFSKSLSVLQATLFDSVLFGKSNLISIIYK